MNSMHGKIFKKSLYEFFYGESDYVLCDKDVMITQS